MPADHGPTPGVRIGIHNGALSASVDTAGGTLLDLRVGGRSLLAGPGRVAPDLGHHGAVLAPWPNRVGHGRYAFAGTTHQLPIDDLPYGHAIHGFAYRHLWRLDHRSEVQVTMSTTVGPAPGYPFQVGLQVTYRLDEDRLVCDASWTNCGSAIAPFGLGFHPYLRPGPSPLETWTLQVPADLAMASDPATRLPLPPEPVAGTPADYRSPRALGDAAFSRAYRLTRDTATDPGVVRLRDPTGPALDLGMSTGFRWVQVFTADLPAPDLRRRGLAVEPQTCPPNALATGEDLLRLAPGQSGGAHWWLRPSLART